MRTIYFALAMLLSWFALPTMAQKDKMTFEGQVLDFATRTPLLGSLVEVLNAEDTVLIDSVRAGRHWAYGDYEHTDAKYYVSIPRKEGNYMLRFSKPGYETAYIYFPVQSLGKRQNTFEIKDALLRRAKVVNMDEVTVTATKLKFYHKGDTLVYNADAFQLEEGSMLDALIRQLPGAKLEANGRITVNGKFVESLLLNGKDFFKGDNQVMLDNLPTYMVDQVKVYEKYGKDSEFLGKKLQRDKQFVMDINLKKQYNTGWNVNAQAGGGTHDRYMARLFAMRFTDHSRLSVFGNVNNLNDENQPGKNSTWSPGDIVGGTKKQLMGGMEFNLSPRSGKLELKSELSVTRSIDDLNENINRTNFLAGGNTYDRVLNTTHDNNFSLRTRNSLYQKFEAFNLGITHYLEYHRFDKDASSSSITSLADMGSFTKAQVDSLYLPVLNSHARQFALNRYLQSSYNHGYNFNTSFLLKSIIKLKNTSDNIMFSILGDYSNGSNQMYDHNLVEFYNKGTLTNTDFRNRYFDNSPSKSYYFNIETAYRFAFSDVTSLSVGYNYIRKYDRRGSSLYRLDKLEGWGANAQNRLGTLPSVELYRNVMDAGNSYSRTTRIDQHGLGMFLEFDVPFKKSSMSGMVSFMLPLSIQHLDYKRGNLNTSLTKRFLLPQSMLTSLYWSTEDEKYSIYTQYQLMPTTPDLTYFIDINDTTNPLNTQLSNSSLKPSFAHIFWFDFSRNYPNKALMWNIEGRFNPTFNAISMGYTYDKATGKRVFQPENVNGNWTGSVSIGGGGAIDKARNLNFKTSIGWNCSRSVDMIGVDLTAGTQRSVVTNSALVGDFKIDYKLGKHLVGYKATASWNKIRGTREDFQPFNVSNLSNGLTAQIALPCKFKLSTDLTLYSRRGFVDKAMNADDLLWNARLSRSFLNEKLTFICDGFDILGQLNNVTRTINAQGISETFTNVIPRYVMFHLIYKLNLNPKAKK